jgi:drug/metabolite transporter (DMT)-like permease
MISLRVSRSTVDLLLTLFCLCSYGFSLLVNGGTSSSYAISERLIILGSVRAVVLFIISAVASCAAPTGGAFTLNKYSCVPIFVVCLSNSGMLPYAELVQSGSAVSSLAPMVGCYAVIPVCVGLALGEGRSRVKIAGIVLALAAVLTLSGAGGRSGSVFPDARSIFLFIATCAAWGFGDVGSAYMGRGVPLAHTAALSAVGQLVFTSAVAGAAVLSGSARDWGGDGGRRGTPSPGATLAMVAANMLGVIGWAFFVVVGAKGGEASTFAPLVSLYVYVPTIFAIVNGENVTARTAVGMLIAALACVLLAASPTPQAAAQAHSLAGGSEADSVALRTAGAADEVDRARDWITRVPTDAASGAGHASSDTAAAAAALPPLPPLPPLMPSALASPRALAISRVSTPRPADVSNGSTPRGLHNLHIRDAPPLSPQLTAQHS